MEKIVDDDSRSWTSSGNGRVWHPFLFFLFELTIVHTQPDFTQLLLCKYSRSHPWAATFFNDPVAQCVLNLFFDFFPVVSRDLSWWYTYGRSLGWYVVECTKVVPGCVLKRSLYSSTMVVRLVLGHSWNFKHGGPLNMGITHSSMVFLLIISSIAAQAHILVLAWHSNSRTATNATGSYPFSSSLDGGPSHTGCHADRTRGKV